MTNICTDYGVQYYLIYKIVSNEIIKIYEE